MTLCGAQLIIDRYACLRLVAMLLPLFHYGLMPDGDLCVGVFLDGTGSPVP